MKKVSWRQSWILVVDALDECKDQQDVGLILELLSGLPHSNAQQLLVFVTSRPDTPIWNGFRQIPQAIYQNVTLHEVDN